MQEVKQCLPVEFQIERELGLRVSTQLDKGVTWTRECTTSTGRSVTFPSMSDLVFYSSLSGSGLYRQTIASVSIKSSSLMHGPLKASSMYGIMTTMNPLRIQKAEPSTSSYLSTELHATKYGRPASMNVLLPSDPMKVERLDKRMAIQLLFKRWYVIEMKCSILFPQFDS